MEISSISIIGLGLIGGSLAKALKRFNPNLSISVIDVDESALSSAFEGGIADKITTADFSILDGSDVVFLCAPVKSSIEYLSKITPYIGKDTIVTDVCSTKSEIIEASLKFDNIKFIGGHPMAGSEKSGYEASIPHLFENAYYVLCPNDNCKDNDLQFLKNLVQLMGAIPVTMTPENHDYVTGSISHLPHIIASCLVNFILRNDAEDNNMKILAAGGFKDITRIASSSPIMWQNICLSNKEPVIKIMDKFIDMLKEFRNELSEEDNNYIYNFFNDAKLLRDTMVANKKSIIPMYYELIADIPDKPGMLGKIATMLGKEDINIKNMNISNSRELEGGCLTISFPDAASRDSATSILREKGIRCYIK